MNSFVGINLSVSPINRFIPFIFQAPIFGFGNDLHVFNRSCNSGWRRQEVTYPPKPKHYGIPYNPNPSTFVIYNDIQNPCHLRGHNQLFSKTSCSRLPRQLLPRGNPGQSKTAANQAHPPTMLPCTTTAFWHCTSSYPLECRRNHSPP